MENSPSRYDWLISIGQFFAWMITSAGAVIDALYIRAAVSSILQALQVVQHDAYQKKGGIGIDLQFGFALTAVDEFVILILGCIALAVVIAIEYYFRKGRPKGYLGKRIRNVVLIEIAVFLVSILIATVL